MVKVACLPYCLLRLARSNPATQAAAKAKAAAEDMLEEATELLAAFTTPRPPSAVQTDAAQRQAQRQAQLALAEAEATVVEAQKSMEAERAASAAAYAEAKARAEASEAEAARLRTALVFQRRQLDVLRSEKLAPTVQKPLKRVATPLQLDVRSLPTHGEEAITAMRARLRKASALQEEQSHEQSQLVPVADEARQSSPLRGLNGPAGFSVAATAAAAAWLGMFGGSMRADSLVEV